MGGSDCPTGKVRRDQKRDDRRGGALVSYRCVRAARVFEDVLPVRLVGP